MQFIPNINSLHFQVFSDLNSYDKAFDLDLSGGKQINKMFLELLGYVSRVATEKDKFNSDLLKYVNHSLSFLDKTLHRFFVSSYL